jgi:putative transposase
LWIVRREKAVYPFKAEFRQTQPPGKAVKGYTMYKLSHDLPARKDLGSLGLYQSLDDLARHGARQLLAQALELEVQDYLARYQNERDDDGRALVVRNGYANPRAVTLSAGTIEVEAPRVNDKRVVEGQRQKFESLILPPYLRRSTKVADLLPVLYLRGLSTKDFAGALKSFFGEKTSGLSESSISRFTQIFSEEREEWEKRSLKGKEYVYIWVDGIHLNVRLEDEKLAVLVVIGVTLQGNKEVIALVDGYRESAESWSDVLRDLKQRGMSAPRLAVGDGALGFWAALREVWPQVKEQRCWIHKMRNVLDKLPEKQQIRGKELLREMMYAKTRRACELAMNLFTKEFEKGYPKSVESLRKEKESLLTFFEFPAKHWIHLRTTNPIESTFATVRLREGVTKGAGSKKAAMGMVFKLTQLAEKSWQPLQGRELLPRVMAGTEYENGKEKRRRQGQLKKTKSTKKAQTRVAA